MVCHHQYQHGCCEKGEALREENARLRAALNEIARGTWNRARKSRKDATASEFARAALAPAQPECCLKCLSIPCTCCGMVQMFSAQPEACRHGGRQQGETPCPDCRSEEEQP